MKVKLLLASLLTFSVHTQQPDPYCMTPSSAGGCDQCIRYYYKRDGACVPVSVTCFDYNPDNGACTSCVQGRHLSNGQCLYPSNRTQVQKPQNLPSQSQDQPQDKVPAQSSTQTQAQTQIEVKIQTQTPPQFQSAAPIPIQKQSQNRTKNQKPAESIPSVTTTLAVVAPPKATKTSTPTANPTASSPSQTQPDSIPQGKRVDNDLNCLLRGPTGCIKCSYRFYVKNNQCMQVNPNCKQWDSSNGNCTQCFPGSTVFNGACVTAGTIAANKGAKQQATRDPYCQTTDASGKCTKCAIRYYSDGSAPCQLVDVDCKDWDDKTGACTACYNGFSLSGPKCVVAGPGSDPYCISYDKGACVSCASRYFFAKDGKCTFVSPYCGEYVMKNGNCTTCIPGYTLIGGSCVYVPAIPVQTPGPQGSDEPTSDSDNQSSSSTSNDLIIQQQLEWQKQLEDWERQQMEFQIQQRNELIRQAQAIQATASKTTSTSAKATTSKIVDANCKKNDTTGLKCIECSKGFWSNNGVCTQINPNCREASMTTGLCTSCFVGFKVDQGSCVPS